MFKLKHPNAIVITLSVLTVLSAIFFNVFHFSSYYGIAQVNYINSLLLIPFVMLVLSLGVFLARHEKDDTPLVEDNIFAQLTQKELTVVELILANHKNTEIAQKMFIELSTVKTHINNIYKKLNISNRQQLKNIAKQQPEFKE
ncbi:hypothetical protein SOPP22_00095 [Shewanella sp. OPT22]|nr:hypothetical protein SOPP22_00095 [Shewanella sp. OPT22]